MSSSGVGRNCILGGLVKNVCGPMFFFPRQKNDLNNNQTLESIKINRQTAKTVSYTFIFGKSFNQQSSIKVGQTSCIDNNLSILFRLVRAKTVHPKLK